MRYAGVIGDPVAHSLSPFMHNAAFRAHGIEATYELWRTAAGDIDDRIARIREDDVLGANVTVPHKQAVMARMDDLSDTARQIGAVNTIVKTAAGLLGDNTDAFGFRRSIDMAYPDLSLDCAVVLGAGGASRAVIVALREMGLQRIILTNRTESRARALGVEFGVDVMPWESVVDGAFADADVLVNATALGWHDETPIEDSALERMPAESLVMDLTYRDTTLLRAAKGKGLNTLDGLGMLIHQGARSFELWLGRPAPVDEMRDAVLSEQARRA